MTVSLGVQEDIRRMDRDGATGADMARELHLSRNTVRKHADMEGMSPEPPAGQERPHPAIDGMAGWIDSMLEADLAVPRKQRHTAKGIYDGAVAEKGHSGPCPSICRYVSGWKGEHVQGPKDGFLELRWAPGTAQVDFGNFVATMGGVRAALKLLAASLPHSNARSCMALPCEGAEVFCRGPRRILERAGRPPRALVPDNATEAGRMAFGKVAESRPFSQSRAHCRRESRYRNPHSGSERGSVGNAVGFPRRNLLVPVPEAGSLEGPNGTPRDGCDRLNAQPSSGDGRPAAQAFQGDPAGMLGLPGVPFDAARWGKAKSDKRGYVRVDGNPYCAGPAWHDRELMVGVRAGTVETLADRARHVATLRRIFGEGESVRNPASLMPAPIARPRAFGESTIREDMPDAPVDAIDRLDGAGRRKAPRVLGGAAGASGFAAACEAEERVFGGGGVPDEAPRDMPARRIAQGRPSDGAGPDPAIYDGLITREAA